MKEKLKSSRHDFVFIDDTGNPYRVRETDGGGYWMYYWSEDSKSWVSWRKCKGDEIGSLYDISLPHDKALLYEAGVKFRE